MDAIRLIIDAADELRGGQPRHDRQSFFELRRRGETSLASVELHKLSRRFGAHTAVDGVSLEIAHGQLVSLLGPSGCGKTTTLRLIAGFLEPSDGEIRVAGRMLSSPGFATPPERRNMSMIFQSYALWPHMTAAENVAYGLEIRKLDRATIRDRVHRIMATARIEALADRYPSELSGGQQQRVSLARALAVEPETLLMDEPLSNLDANLREEMRFEIRRMHDAFGTTTVYVTHDQAEAMTTADLIAVMNAGRIEQLGTPEEVYDRPVSEFVARFIGASNVVRGKALDASRIDLAGTPVRTTGRDLVAGQSTSISIRQHQIGIVAATASPPGDNVVPATVRRHVFLGNSRDYMVTLADGTEMRIASPAEQSIGPDTAVWLHLPPERCRALAN
jgi:iron(III) transport system ATP-binding protein